MKKIAFHIQKGGVGKTTISGNIASYFTSQNQKTILVDCDPQGNTTSWFITDQEVTYELADVLRGDVSIEEAIVEISSNFYLLPTFSLNGTLKNYAETKLFQEPFVFDDLCNQLGRYNFNYAIFDLSPGMSMLERSVLLAMDEVITPLTPEYFSVDGVEIFNDELNKINKNYRKQITHKRIVINVINRSFKLHKSYLEHFKSLNYEIYYISQDANIPKAQTLNQSIFDFNTKSRAVSEFEKLAHSIS